MHSIIHTFTDINELSIPFAHLEGHRSDAFHPDFGVRCPNLTRAAPDVQFGPANSALIFVGGMVHEDENFRHPAFVNGHQRGQILIAKPNYLMVQKVLIY